MAARCHCKLGLGSQSHQHCKMWCWIWCRLRSGSIKRSRCHQLRLSVEWLWREQQREFWLGGWNFQYEGSPKEWLLVLGQSRQLATHLAVYSFDEEPLPLVLIPVRTASHAPTYSFDSLNELFFSIHALELSIAGDCLWLCLRRVLFHLCQKTLGFFLNLLDLILILIRFSSPLFQALLLLKKISHFEHVV